jgi:hypothetical protein
LAGALALSVVVTLREASADIVHGPHADCPDGTRTIGGSHSHHGSCQAYSCDDGATRCPAGTTCQEVALCVDALVEPDSPIELEQIMGTCEGGASCAQGTCQRLRVCARGRLDRRQGSGCGVEPGRGCEAPGLVVTALIAALLAFRWTRLR